MIFNSIEFLVFFPIVVFAYLLIPGKFKKYWLLIASYYFYMSWSATYALLILFTTVVTYLCGLLLEKTAKKKLVVGLCFGVNLGILVVFKYFDFLLMSLNQALGVFRIHPIEGSLNLLLPVGISFYTFQTLGYVVDVYRKTVPAERNFIRYALFVSFFPQLVAGPIERSKNLVGQIHRMEERRLWDYRKMVSGFSMMCYGLFIKMVLADRIALFVDYVWDNLQLVGMVETVLAAFAFAIQIYCDFSGYSTIAIGAARVMGFDLMENFNAPYFTRSIAQFWRNWHISLSIWFRDYLYIPLGGSRCSKAKKYRNIMITFLTSGLWHGANWTYVLWGAMHGMYQIIGDLLKPVKAKIRQLLRVNEEADSFKFGQILVNFTLVSMAFAVFRAPSIEEAIRFFRAMLTRPNPWVLSGEALFTMGINRVEGNILLMALVVLLLVDLVRYKKQVDIGEYLLRQNLLFRWIVLLGLIAAVVIFGEYGINFDSAQFIYFQF